MTVTYRGVLDAIGKINSFAEESDRRIKALRNNFKDAGRNLEDQCNDLLLKAKAKLDSGMAAINKKAETILANANAICDEIMSLDSELAKSDRHYTKAASKKDGEFAEKCDAAAPEERDIFSAMEKTGKRYKEIAGKYSKTSLPATIDGIAFAFSKQRKRDYDELIALRRTLENLRDEVVKALPKIVDDAVEAGKKEYGVHAAAVKSGNREKLAALGAHHENNINNLANDICRNLDAILPNALLRRLREANETCDGSFAGITTSNVGWDRTIAVGHIDFPVELYVRSKILFSLIKDKCADIFVQNKLMRFPFAFSLRERLNVLIEYAPASELKNDFIHSLIRSFIRCVPVGRLTFDVIDAESRGGSTSGIRNMADAMSFLFNGGVVAAQEKVEARLEKIIAYIEDVAARKLRDSYADVFEYADSNPEDPPGIKVLVIFDSPSFLGDKIVSMLNAIMEKGSRCGVYVILTRAQDPCRPDSPGKDFNDKYCIVVKQSGDTLLHLNMRVLFNDIPSAGGFTEYDKKYLLTHDVLRGNSALLNRFAENMIMDEYSEEIQKRIDSSKNMIESLNDSFCAVPPGDKGFPPAVTIGCLSYPDGIIASEAVREHVAADLPAAAPGTFLLPAVFALGSRNNVLIDGPMANHRQIEKFIHSMMWNFLSSIPVGMIDFCVFDAENRGNSITPFFDLRKKLPDIFDGQIYTSNDAITNRLQKLNERIDEFIQNNLGSRFDTIVEYNGNMPNRMESVTILTIFDFPGGFDAGSIELLSKIMNDGGKCGMYAIIHNNSDIAVSKYANISGQLAEIRKLCSVFEYSNGDCLLQPYGLPATMPRELPKERMARFADEYADAVIASKSKGHSFEDIAGQPHFSSSIGKNLSIPVGIGDNGDIVSMVFGEGSSHHGIIAGATGGGKSTLLHTIIMSGMLRHGPEKLHLYLMDFKSGTEFKIYESVRLPHIQLLALDAMQEFGESILENLVGEMLRRGSLFKEAGQTSLHDYIAHTKEDLPRILVVIDEFQVLFNESVNRKIARNCADLTKRIVTEGRAFGIHLLMATQTTKIINELSLPQSVIEQMRIRVGLKCGDDVARFLFGDENDRKALAMMKGPIGTAVMNMEYMESDNIGFHVAYCGKEVQRRYLTAISGRFADRPANTRIFEGNRNIRLLDFLNENRIGISPDGVVKMHMGEMVKVAPPFAVQFDRRRRHNLLICGANEGMSENLCNLCIFTALLNSNAELYCIDGCEFIDEGKSTVLYDALSALLPRFAVIRTQPEIVECVNKLHISYSERKAGNGQGPAVVVLKNFQHIDIIKKALKGERINEDEIMGRHPERMSPKSGPDVSFTDKLLRLIGDGSGCGIFFVASTLEFQAVRENMYYGENILAKFTERIVFSMNKNEAENVIAGASISSLHDNAAYYSDGIKEAFPFKPYVMPDIPEMEEYVKRFSISYP